LTPRQLPTTELIERVAGWVREGCELSVAARAAGIPGATHERWRERARSEFAEGITAGESAYVAYEHAIDTAEALATVAAVLHLSEAAKHDQRAAKALLELRSATRAGTGDEASVGATAQIVREVPVHLDGPAGDFMFPRLAGGAADDDEPKAGGTANASPAEDGA
jgi:hypothetical protein